MNTFAISDLHLCDRGPRDNFSFNGREGRFNRFLDFVERSKGRLLILGDLFDWWQVPMGETILAYLPLLDRLAALGAEWVVGNHDGARPADRFDAYGGPSAFQAVVSRV